MALALKRHQLCCEIHLRYSSPRASSIDRRALVELDDARTMIVNRVTVRGDLPTDPCSRHGRCRSWMAAIANWRFRFFTLLHDIGGQRSLDRQKMKLHQAEFPASDERNHTSISLDETLHRLWNSVCRRQASIPLKRMPIIRTSSDPLRHITLCWGSEAPLGLVNPLPLSSPSPGGRLRSTPNPMK